MSEDRPSKAQSGLRALRRRLASSSPSFADADAGEAKAARFVADVRRRLQSARKHKGWPQQEVAARLELGQPAVSGIETGDGDIGLRALYRYARALGLRPEVRFVEEGRDGSRHASRRRLRKAKSPQELAASRRRRS